MEYRLPRVEPARILCVDDLPELRRSLCRALRALGHFVVEADGGRRALVEVAAQEFDLVLSDVMMPDMNGLELLSALRHRDASVPVVLMSTVPSPAIVSQATASGAFEFLAKPVRQQTLQETIARALHAQRAARAEGLTKRAASDPSDVYAG